MDDWLRVPGVRVIGHRATVVPAAAFLEAACTCGHRSPAYGSVDAACLALVRHLRTALRQGAGTTGGDDDGGEAGVREPRRPRPPGGADSRALDLSA